MAEQIYAAEQKVEPKDSRTKTLIYELKKRDGKARPIRWILCGIFAARVDGDAAQPYIDDQLENYELWEPESEYDSVWWWDKVFLANVLRDRPAAWLPKGISDYDTLLVAAADAAVARLAEVARHGDPLHAEWGELHPLEIYHPLGRSGILRRILSIGPIEQGGTIDTVRAMGYRHGPAMRFVADLSNWDRL